jgi:hypothetical protein
MTITMGRKGDQMKRIIKNVTTRSLAWIGGIAFVIVLVSNILDPPPLENWHDWFKLVVLYIVANTVILGWLILLLVVLPLAYSGILDKLDKILDRVRSWWRSRKIRR